MPRKIKRYGWRPSLPHNAKKYSTSHHYHTDLPPMVDLRPKCPPVYDQGELGSCTANGIAACVQFVDLDFSPSRLFIYYNERSIEGDVDQDGGAEIHDGIKSVHEQGVCPESEWPYDITKFTNKPSDQCYTDALNHQVQDYSSLDNINDIKQCLVTGYPVVFGMTVYESFESQHTALTGMVTMPTRNEQVVGGHCMVIVGYDDSKKSFIVRNSWGSGWGLAGYCYIPYEYIQHFASDFWTVRMVEQ